jgi:PAS domain S-box-containing protein
MAISFEFFGSASGADADELRSRLRRLEALIARAPVPIAIAHDAGCRMISANEALAELLGVSPDENISLTPPPGQTPRYRIQLNGQDIPARELPMQYAIAHRTAIKNDIEILRADGTVRYIQNDVEPLSDSDGTTIGCVSVCMDLTEQRRAERLLREADRRKDEFLASLSHELRNPLVPLRNALDELRRSGGDPLVAGRAYAIMERQLFHLVRLTDDLLDVSRITSNRIDLQRARIDLRTVLQSAIETTQPLIAVAGQILTVDIPRDPVWVHADFTRLSQAVSNLMNNAVKYTPRGGRITLRAAQDDGDIMISVSDTGVGIAPSALPQIFDMFMHGNDPTDQPRDGLGIGLTLARRLIELHDGRIQAASDGPGTGATFVIRLPRSTDDSSRRSAEGAKADGR